MAPRPQRRVWTLSGLALSAVLLAPAQASGAARDFKVGLPKAGEVSVARVALTAKPTRAGVRPVVRGMRLVNARRIPRNAYVAGRLTRVGRTNRYIARVVVFRPGAPGTTARAAQDKPPFQPPYISLFPHNRVDIGQVADDENVITDPDPVDMCFGPPAGSEWTRFTPLAHPGLVARDDRDDLTRAAVDFFCARPVPDGFANRFDSYDPIPFFAGVHRSFEGSSVEHIFRVHGNEDMGGFSLDPPPGRIFVACGGAVPCLVNDGRILVFGPFAAGQDVDVNGRLDGEIPRVVTGNSYPGDSTGPFNGPPREITLKRTGFRF